MLMSSGLFNVGLACSDATLSAVGGMGKIPTVCDEASIALIVTVQTLSPSLASLNELIGVIRMREDKEEKIQIREVKSR